MRSMEMEEQCSARITWDVLVSSLHFGCRGCILDEGWAALDSARHRGDQRESDRGSEHRLESRSIAEGRQKDARRKAREPVLCLGADGAPLGKKESSCIIRKLQNFG